MKRILFSLLVLLVTFALVTPAHALMINRGTGVSTHGSYNLIYDTDFDITWYDFSRALQINTTGNWTFQNNWADALTVNFGGVDYDDWRLPTAFNSNGSGPGAGTDVTDSEMGHLYYTELGNTAGGGLANTGDFQDLQSDFFYWSGTETSFVTSAWHFNFSTGNQNHANKEQIITTYALAVRSGDVAAVPEPTTVALLGIGLAGMVAYGVKRRRQSR